MELSTVQQIILVILASALAIFLILAVAIAVMILRLLKTIRMIADKAEKVIETAESVGEVFKKAAAPAGVFHFIQGIVDAARHKK
ncbi:MAG TPA: hypothetical protein VFT16_03870 [Candidatus Saccharimonadales bacterium]|nr:hypothetical protein [Candidatus Saccharimonadales bacterium]